MNEVSKLIDRTITEVTLDSSVTTIGNYAFTGCSALTSVTVNATTPPTLGSGAFDRTNDSPIYVPAGTLSAYESASDWGMYADRIFEYGVAKWVEKSYECELDGSGKNTGYVIVTEIDTNPSSSTYNTTRTRTYEDLERCNTVPGFTKITSLADATSGKYLIVKTTVNKALNASLIKDTTTGTSGINTANNMIDVTIENDIIAQDDNTLNAAADYDADKKTLSWTDSDTGTTYYLYWNGSGAKFAYNGITQPSMNYPMEPTYYRGFNSFSFANSRKLIAYNTTGPKFYFCNPNSNVRFEENMALFKLN